MEFACCKADSSRCTHALASKLGSSFAALHAHTISPAPVFAAAASKCCFARSALPHFASIFPSSYSARAECANTSSPSVVNVISRTGAPSPLATASACSQWPSPASFSACSSWISTHTCRTLVPPSSRAKKRSRNKLVARSKSPASAKFKASS